MNESQQITIEPLTAYSPDDAAAIGRLIAQLTSKASGEPVEESLLSEIINSPFHDQLVARLANGNIVGTATVSILMGPVKHHCAWLEDFVVDSNQRQLGIGGKLWDATMEWCREHDAKQLTFTSNATKQAAHAFYLKRGAVIHDTCYFKKQIDIDS